MADYNGWTNYPTWAVKLWLDNDQYNQEVCNDLAHEASSARYPEVSLANNLKEIVGQNTPDMPASMYQDILGWALEQVAWREIAEAFLEDVEDVEVTDSMTTKWQPDTEPQITTTIYCRIGEYEPGNGTRYTAVAVPWRATPNQVMGAMGFVSNGWLVVSGNSARAYLFQGDGGLGDTHIQEHLGGYDGDYPYFGDLIRALTGRPDIPHSDIDTIDEEHDQGLRDLTDPFTGR